MLVPVRSTTVVLVALAAVEAFNPGNLPCLRSINTRSNACPTIVMQRSGKRIDRKDGFGGGFDSIQEGIEKRSKDDWGGNGTGGASGKLGGGGVTDFAAYMAKRAQEQGGTVTDAAGNDITDAKPTYKVQEGAWGAPEDDEPDYDPTEWVDKSVTGFGKTDTSWLTEDVPEIAQMQDERAQKKAEEDAAIEAKMQMWLKAAAEKKAREGQ